MIFRQVIFSLFHFSPTGSPIVRYSDNIIWASRNQIKLLCRVFVESLLKFILNHNNYVSIVVIKLAVFFFQIFEQKVHVFTLKK